MKLYASEIRVGMLIEYKNDLWQVLKTQHVKPGKGGAFAQVEMKSVNKNTMLITNFIEPLTLRICCARCLRVGHYLFVSCHLPL